MADRRGLLIILSSPSGAGKSTLARRLMDWDPSLKFSVSATTRQPRPGEEHGREYFFLEEREFKQQAIDGEMLEHAHVFGNFYGSPAGPVKKTIDSGQDVLFDVDWQGEIQIRNSDLGKHALSIFILPPSIRELRRRLETRAQDSEDVIGKRMLKSWDEISHWGYYDYVLINDDLNETEERLKTIVQAERMRRIQQPSLTQHVRVLQNEFEDQQ
ncbi:guanylate kinase [Parasedimentitalea maritima]|uniref:Guanylate kinase n=1 Tax=Parasedimentitalea maritima TaxID=2578117 RepID=A0ABY2UPU5_9RHOB|nr:guanylate kinase [Zongyanglinia marina]TLP56861.1 guanylate kinase [Zongyanglinia marina]